MSSRERTPMHELTGPELSESLTSVFQIVTFLLLWIKMACRKYFNGVGNNTYAGFHKLCCDL